MLNYTVMLTESGANLSNKLTDEKWLAGLIEIGAGLGYSRYLKKGRLYTYPYIHLTDNSELKILRLQTLLGGRKINRSGNSWEWRLEGEQAADLLIPAKPYTPWREGMIESFIQWLGANRLQREQIAQQTSAQDRSKVNQEDYIPLIDMPQFFAGAIDGRGAAYRYRKNTLDRLIITSPNIILLAAIGNKYNVKVQDKVSIETNGKSYGIEITNQVTLKEIEQMTSSYRRLKV